MMSDTEQETFKEIKVFCLDTLHLWVRIFGKFPEIKGLTYAHDGNIITTLSTDLKFISVLTPVSKEDDNLDFNIGKTKVLTKGPTTAMCLNAENISSTPILIFQILLNISPVTCSRRLRVLKYLDLRWAMTASLRL